MVCVCVCKVVEKLLVTATATAAAAVSSPNKQSIVVIQALDTLAATTQRLTLL